MDDEKDTPEDGALSEEDLDAVVGGLEGPGGDGVPGEAWLGEAGVGEAI